MKIVVTSVLVDDQEKALNFYTKTLGFVKKHDIPMGEYRWLTLTAPSQPDGVELVLEPDAHPAAKPFKQALVEDGIPYTSFGVEDVQAEYERLQTVGVRFTQPPVQMGNVVTAVFDDTCGNLIQVAVVSCLLRGTSNMSRTLLQRFLGFIVGLIAAGALVVGVEFFSEAVYPLPKEVHELKGEAFYEAVCQHVAGYPHWILGVVVLLWGAAISIGVGLASFIGGRVPGFRTLFGSK
jgi:catechol 2,3-dioxygenase-like lactoylglutathione lyase family enzyme